METRFPDNHGPLILGLSLTFPEPSCLSSLQLCFRPLTGEAAAPRSTDTRQVSGEGGLSAQHLLGGPPFSPPCFMGTTAVAFQLVSWLPPLPLQFTTQQKEGDLKPTFSGHSFAVPSDGLPQCRE